MSDKQKILHVDGDAFFASVERAQYPHLRGKPVVVGMERGIATAATYEAKRLGVARGMPIWQVRKNFPSVTILPTHFELYEMYAEKLYSLLKKFSNTVQRYSIDECFCLIDEEDAEASGGWQPYLHQIKEDVQKSLGVTYSFGLADTKVLAKVASKYQKPDGKTLITPATRRDFLERTPIGAIWGIGYQTTLKLERRGLKNALQFAELSRNIIEGDFSEPLLDIWYELNGTPIFKVDPMARQYSKSLQATRTFTPPSNDRSLVFSELSKNIETVCSHLRSEGQLARKAWIFLKRADFRRVGREVLLPYPTGNPSQVLAQASEAFSKIFDSQIHYRSTGATLYDLVPSSFSQDDLFGNNESMHARDSYLESIDMIRGRFGMDSIHLASSLLSVKRRQSTHASEHASDPYIGGLPFPYLGEAS